MKQLNEAQKLNAAWLGVDLDFYSPDTAGVATHQTQDMVSQYKAPHAPRGTYQRPKDTFKTKAFRLLTGHRP